MPRLRHDGTAKLVDVVVCVVMVLLCRHTVRRTQVGAPVLGAKNERAPRESIIWRGKTSRNFGISEIWFGSPAAPPNLDNNTATTKEQ
eukprot:scaffold1959_cov162-Amphora_coffeaeformis.AAC.15